jgi:hypothetical protein
MGKASKLKQIRKAASQMPVLKTYRPEVEIVSGVQLINSGIKELKDGTPVDVKKDYKQVTPVPVALNHNRQMKRLYNAKGAKGVIDYINQVAQIAAGK